MDFYCYVCDNFIKPKSKYKHFQSNTHKEFDTCKNVELTIENPDINNVDKLFYAYNSQHNNEFDYYLIKCHFKLVFNDNQNSTWIQPNLFNIKAKIPWNKNLEEVIEKF